MSSRAERPRIGALLFVALREEQRPVERCLSKRRNAPVKGLRLTCGDIGDVPVAVCRLGIGRTRAEQRASEVLAAVEPTCVAVLGFGGGLTAAQKNGEVVLARTVTEVDFHADAVVEGRRWDTDPVLLEHLLGRMQADVKCGQLASSAEILRGAGDKRRVAETCGADVVEMESAGVLSARDARSESSTAPVVSLRIVLDEHDFELPLDFGKIVHEDGSPRPLRAAAALGVRPDLWGQVLKLRQRAVAAAAQLEAIVPEFVGALSQWTRASQDP